MARTRRSKAAQKGWDTRRRNDRMELFVGVSIALMDMHNVDPGELIDMIVTIVARRIHDS